MVLPPLHQLLYGMTLHQMSLSEMYRNVTKSCRSLTVNSSSSRKQIKPNRSVHWDFTRAHKRGEGRREGTRTASHNQQWENREATKAENRQGEHTTSSRNKGKERGGREGGESTRNIGRQKRKSAKQNTQQSKTNHQRDN